MAIDKSLGVGFWTPDLQEKKGFYEEGMDDHYNDDFSETHSYLDYTANLDLPYHRLPVFDSTKECKPRYLVKGCGCNRKILPSGCMNTKCPECAKVVGKRRAAKASRRFFAEKKHITLLYTVFTIPEKLRGKFVDKKEWQKLRKKTWKMLKKHFGGRFGLEASHPAGDYDDKVFHPHFNFLWQQRPGFRPFIDVTRLRSIWSKILGAVVVDIHHQFSSKMKKIKHWCRYVTRMFTGCHTWTGPTRWYGQYPKVKKVKEIFCCPKCEEEYEYIGFIENDLVTEYHRSIDGRDPPWFDDQNLYKLNRGM